MKKFLFAICLIVTISQARENPFFPAEGEEALTVTTNEKSDIERLKSASIELPKQARVLQKVTIEFKNLDGSVETKSIDIDRAVDWHLPLFISQNYTSSQSVKHDSPTIKSQRVKLASLDFINILSEQKSIILDTNDAIIRDFLLTEPHRIVIDLKRDTSFKSFLKEYHQGIIKSIKIGNHDRHYRVVIELDGLYQYARAKVAGGHIFELK